MRTLLTFTKLGDMRLLSHLDMTRLFRRAIKRAGVDICYTEGFNPQQKLAVTNPLPLGYESTAEMMLIETDESFTEEKRTALNAQLPNGVQVTAFVEMEGKVDLHTAYRFSTYEVIGLSEAMCEAFQQAIAEIREKPEVIYTRESVKKGKRKVQTKDLVPLTGPSYCEGANLIVTLGSHDVDTIRPSELLPYLAEQQGLLLPESLRYRRIAQLKGRPGI